MKEVLNIISKKYHMPFVVSNTNNKQNDLIFTENQNNTKLKKLIITNCPPDFIGISLDDCFPFCQYFNADKDMVNKKCDIILLSNKSIILIDAKSDSVNRTDVQKQLNNTKYFAKYLLDLAKHFDSSISSNIPIHMCVVKTGIEERNQASLINQKKLGFEIFTKLPYNKEVRISLSEISKKFKLE